MLTSKSRAGLGRAIETYHYRPTYADANVGHPSCSMGSQMEALERFDGVWMVRRAASSMSSPEMR